MGGWKREKISSQNWGRIFLERKAVRNLGYWRSRTSMGGKLWWFGRGGGHNGKIGVVSIYGYNGVWLAQHGADLIGDDTSYRLGWVMGISSDRKTFAIGSLGAKHNYTRV